MAFARTNPLKAFGMELAKLTAQQKVNLFRIFHLEQFSMLTQLWVSTTLLKYSQLEYLRLHLRFDTAS